MCAVCAVIDIEKAMVCNKNQNRTTKEQILNPQGEEFLGKLNEKHEI